MHRYVERVVDLLDPSLNVLHDMTEDEARARVLSADPDAVRGIEGSFALVARDGITVCMARSLDRPMRYFLAKRAEGPALFIADRMDTLRSALAAEGLAHQFHPSYTRMVPAHHVVELRLVGCPDPDPTYTRFFTPERSALPPNLDVIGQRYIGALAFAVARWLQHVDRVSSGTAPIGVCFSGHRQRIGVPRGVRHDAAPRHVASATQGVRARCGWSRCRAGPRVPRPTGPRPLLRGDRRGPRGARSAGNPARARGLQAARRRMRGTRPAPLPRHPRAISGVALHARWRRRRREPQGLPHRGESRAYDPQRRRQPHAVSGGMGGSAASSTR